VPLTYPGFTVLWALQYTRTKKQRLIVDVSTMNSNLRPAVILHELGYGFSAHSAACPYHCKSGR